MPHHHQTPDQDARTYWDELYGDAPRWSGRVNPVLAEVAGSLTPGRALDVGAGEGGDALWLAERGWRVTAADVSTKALGRLSAAAAAREAGAMPIDTWCGDLEHERPAGEFDLISAQFFQSPLTFPRERVLRELADQLVAGGHLLVVDHATTPPWGGPGHHDLPTVEQTVAAIGLDADTFTTLRVETRPRLVTGPDGQRAEILDAVFLARREA